MRPIPMSHGRIKGWVVITKYLNVLMHIVCNNRIFLGALGLLNRCSGRRLIDSVFLAYPANENIIRRHMFLPLRSVFRTSPGLLGFFLVNRRLTLIFSLAAVEAEIFQFSRPELVTVQRNLGRIQRRLGAKHRTMAGVLPSVMLRAGVLQDNPQRDATVHIVCAAVEAVLGREGLGPAVPVVIVGALGHIGQGVCETLSRTRQTIALDRGDDVAQRLRDLHQPHLVLNVASYTAWKSIVPGLGPGAIVLNEVYPPPSGSVRHALTALAPLYHVSGVKTTWSMPRLAEGYHDVMPCCAATGDPQRWQPKVIRLQ